MAKIVKKVITTPKAAPKTTTKATPKTATKTATKVAPKTATKAAPKTATKAAPKTATKAAPKTDTKAAPKTATKAAPKTATKAAPKTATKTTTKEGANLTNIIKNVYTNAPEIFTGVLIIKKVRATLNREFIFDSTIFRILRKLRSNGTINYVCIDSNKSIFKKLPIKK